MRKKKKKTKINNNNKLPKPVENANFSYKTHRANEQLMNILKEVVVVVVDTGEVSLQVGGQNILDMKQLQIVDHLMLLIIQIVLL